MNDIIEQKIRDSFSRQGFMQTLGARITSLETGRVCLQCAFRDGLSQQNGFFHAGVLSSIADSACGYAALSVMPEDADVLSVEFKINLLKPANTEKIEASGVVIQAGKRLVVCEAGVTDAVSGKLLAKMTATMIVLV
ncbi:MAG: PaaI family thioesterase [Saprospiraceae bacterium]|nr:PaaI family thioesterase [Saprospiraceae bacterium]